MPVAGSVSGSAGPTFRVSSSNSVWSSGLQPASKETIKAGKKKDEPNSSDMSPVWQPFGAVPDAKPQFHSIKPNLHQERHNLAHPCQERSTTADNQSSIVSSPNGNVSSTSTPPTATPSPPTSVGSLNSPSSIPSAFTRVGGTSGLPPSQSPTITLLQKAREGQIPKGAIYIDHKIHEKDEVPEGARLVNQRVTMGKDKIYTDSYYALPIQEMGSTTVTLNAPPKYEGIGPTEYGIPVGLRTDGQFKGVKDEYASDWYRSMYRSLHKFDRPQDYSTVAYQKQGKVTTCRGYMSEPELDREDQPKRYAAPDTRSKPEWQTILESPAKQQRFPPASARSAPDVYRNQPRSIAEYEPGRSSLAERENRLDDHRDTLQARRYMPGVNHSRRTFDGYESDSMLIRKTGRSTAIDPQTQKAWYREIQRGGEIPLKGLGKPAPPKAKEPVVGPPPPLPKFTDGDSTSACRPASPARPESPHRYQETEVNIHFRSPIRMLEKEFVDEEELRHRQEDAMRRFYAEERYKKQLQQAAEIEMRRHSDNFVPTQKSPIPLNRYDNPFNPSTSPATKTPEPRSMARVLYSFTAQSVRELSLCKGDIVYVIRKVDRNWYEGEHHGMIGIFPVKYVEIIPPESANLQPRKPMEGQAKAKFNFCAQTPIELSLFKGETVVLTRRVDKNWYEGRIGNKWGIFPSSYVEVLREPDESNVVHVSPKPPASPVYSPIVNGISRQSAYQLSTKVQRNDNLSSPHYQQNFGSRDPALFSNVTHPVTQSLHIDTNSEPIPYRALYGYRPQNDDELELREGDTIFVMEKCDDGWYVGTSMRSGLFGTFPGNYVERI